MFNEGKLLTNIPPAPISGMACQVTDEVRLVHWWVTGGEAAALNVLKKNLSKEGVGYNDTPISGGAKMMTELQTMVATGDIPTAAVMSGYSTQDWARKGVLSDLSSLAAAGDWENVIPEALQKFCKFNGKWIGVPLSLHSINWLWINKVAAEKVGLKAPPATMDELFVVLERARSAGLVPMAIGGQPWLMATLFDSVVMATNGIDFYKKAFIELDAAALTSPEMTKAFQNLAKLASYTDSAYSGRNWSDATDMVVTGQALLEVAGDWVKAEFRAAQKESDTDYMYARFPGTEDDVIFNSDIIVMFDVEPDRQAAQMKLAKAIMDPAFQSLFNDDQAWPDKTIPCFE